MLPCSSSHWDTSKRRIMEWRNSTGICPWEIGCNGIKEFESTLKQVVPHPTVGEEEKPREMNFLDLWHSKSKTVIKLKLTYRTGSLVFGSRCRQAVSMSFRSGTVLFIKCKEVSAMIWLVSRSSTSLWNCWRHFSLFLSAPTNGSIFHFFTDWNEKE